MRWPAAIPSESRPLRLLVVSDLHVDYPQNRPRVEALVRRWRDEPADALVVAGDVSHKLDQLESALRVFDAIPVPKLFVAGNHDIWIVKPDLERYKDSWAKLGAVHAAARVAGFHCLDEANLRMDDWTFVGSIAWYDYSFAHGALGLDASAYRLKRWQDLHYMDGAYARWGVDDEAVAARFTAGVAARLDAAQGRVVFVSHHVPLEELVLRRGHASWDFFNAYMGSRELERRLRARGVTRYVFGHTHRPVSLVEPGRCVINNPIGYPRQALTPIPAAFVVS